MKEEVYELLTRIPKGYVITYGDISSYLGNKKLSRVVGNILHNNPNPIKNPCYKVVNRNGMLSSNYAYGGIDAQKNHLEEDGIEVINYKVDLNKYRWIIK